MSESAKFHRAFSMGGERLLRERKGWMLGWERGSESGLTYAGIDETPGWVATPPLKMPSMMETNTLRYFCSCSAVMLHRSVKRGSASKGLTEEDRRISCSG